MLQIMSSLFLRRPIIKIRIYRQSLVQKQLENSVLRVRLVQPISSEMQFEDKMVFTQTDTL